MSRYVAAIALLAGLTACTYPVETPPAEAVPVVTAYAARVPGKWALIVDVSKANTTLEDSGPRCSQSDYPLDLAPIFAQTAEATFRTVAEDLVVSDHALSKSELAAGGYSGVIIVGVTGLRGKLTTTGLIESRAAAETEIDGAIVVIKGGERMVDSRQSGKGDAERDTHIDCSGAGEAASAASQTAIEALIPKLAEQFANSHAIRYSIPGLSPQ